MKNEEQALFVNGLMDAIPVDVFSYANIERAGEILVPKEQKNEFESMLTAKDIKYSILTENIKE